MEMGAWYSDLTLPSISSETTSFIADAFASCAVIVESMQDVVEDDGLPMLHRSKWRCLAHSYSQEIKFLISRMCLFHRTWLQLLPYHLQALEQAVQEGEARMHDYLIPKSNLRSWLVDKALKLAMNTDVVDVLLHHFLWVTSTVYHHLSIAYRSTIYEWYAVMRTQTLCKIWDEVDSQGDLQIAQDLLIELKAKTQKDTETCQLLDFILHKFSHMDAPQNHVTPLSLPPNYMCIDSNQCLQRNVSGLLFKNHSTEIREVVWLGKHFALKSFHHMDCNNPPEMEKFNREAVIQAGVCHSHVLPLVCCTSKPPGLLMELMKEDLHALIIERKLSSGKDSPFPLEMAVDMMLQIAKGMQCLHDMGIVHRDLKSHNILVSNSHRGDSNLHLKIGDFGVSKAKHDCYEYTTKDQGTTSWMAPEVYGGEGESNIEPRRYSNKADVYSFGMVCFEILTGNRPFEGGGICSRVVKGERPKLPPDCPRALSSLIEMCWDAEATRRPNFNQICSILHYFKACIFLKDCCVDKANHTDWLSNALISLDFSVNLDLFKKGACLSNELFCTFRPLKIPWDISVLGLHIMQGLDSTWVAF